MDIEEANRETDCCKNEESDNKVHPPGNYQPPMAVGCVACIPFQTVGSVVEFPGAVRVDADVDTYFFKIDSRSESLSRTIS